jgi:ribose 5-phosphate isomerase B
MRFAVASDHAGYALKEAAKRHLVSLGHVVEDFGTGGTESCDYPDHGAAAARAVAGGRADRGVLVCGSGQGMCMVANKVRGVRAALAWNAEIAALSRRHNDANVLCLPARFVSEADALAIVDAWLAAEFEGGRHATRIGKLVRLEREE